MNKIPQFNKPIINDDENLWGTKLNSIVDLIQTYINNIITEINNIANRLSTVSNIETQIGSIQSTLSQKVDNYVYEEYKTQIQNKFTTKLDLSVYQNDKSNLENTLNQKVDLLAFNNYKSTVYNKSEVDIILSDITLKANKNLDNLSEVGIDKIRNLARQTTTLQGILPISVSSSNGSHTISIDTSSFVSASDLVGKADIANVYTKQQANNMFALKTDLNTKVGVDAVYTKEQSNSIFVPKTELVNYVTNTIYTQEKQNILSSLESKANKNGNNLTSEDIASWKSLLNVSSGSESGTQSNVTKANLLVSTDFSINGTGKILDNDITISLSDSFKLGLENKFLLKLDRSEFVDYKTTVYDKSTIEQKLSDLQNTYAKITNLNSVENALNNKIGTEQFQQFQQTVYNKGTVDEKLRLLGQSLNTNDCIKTASNEMQTINSSLKIKNSLIVDGEITSNDNVTAFSDIKLKENIEKIDNPLEKIDKLNGYTYIFKTDNTNRIGVIAQEVETVFPQAVSSVIVDGETYKTVKYDYLIPLLIECVKELKKQNDFLMEKIK